MSNVLRRNRNQVFRRFLPGSIMTIDGETVEVKRHFVVGAVGNTFSEAYVRRIVVEELNKWEYKDPAFKRITSNSDTSSFELVKMEKVQARPVELYECKECRAVQDAGQGSDRGRCRRCGGNLRVMPFLLIHTCGKIKSLRVPECKDHKRDYIKLERYGKFRWVCGICNWSEDAFTGMCGNNCGLILQKALFDTKRDKMFIRRNVSDPSIHNSQIITLLNPPGEGVAKLLTNFELKAKSLFLADYLGVLPSYAQKAEQAVKILNDIESEKQPQKPVQNKLEQELELMGITREKIAQILKTAREEVAATNPRIARSKGLEEALKEAEGAIIDGGICSLDKEFHKQIRDHVLTIRLDNVVSLTEVMEELKGNRGPRAIYGVRVEKALSSLSEIGVEKASYLPQMPIMSAAYGYTRCKSKPSDLVMIKAFSDIISTRGSAHNVSPIFVENANTEALMFELSSKRIIAWLAVNGWLSSNEAITLDVELKRKAWLIRNQVPITFNGIPENVGPLAWLIGSCLHSVSHMLMGQIAAQSSFGETSLSEMLFPATLSTVIFVNQTSEFSLGGLRTFMEQRLDIALKAIMEDEGCMFDPGCQDDGGACVGCLFVPEVSCRLLNNALSRHLLYGGPPTGDLARLISNDIIGYFHPLIRQKQDELFS